jgi:hypothetical protein
LGSKAIFHRLEASATGLMPICAQKGNFRSCALRNMPLFPLRVFAPLRDKNAQQLPLSFFGGAFQN